MGELTVVTKRTSAAELRRWSRQGDVATQRAARAELQRRLSPPSAEWLAGRIATFLGHFYVPAESPEEAEARIEDWLDVLDGLSQAAISEACTRLLRASGGRRPTPGDVWGIANAIDRENREAAKEPAQIHTLTDAEIREWQERRRAQIAELAGKFPHLIKRVDR